MNICAINACLFEYQRKQHRVYLHGVDSDDKEKKIDLNSPTDLRVFCEFYLNPELKKPIPEAVHRIDYRMVHTHLERENGVWSFVQTDRRGRNRRAVTIGRNLDMMLLGFELPRWYKTLDMP